jgi:antitoxin component of MazEF toxin-antitoxin module
MKGVVIPQHLMNVVNSLYIDTTVQIEITGIISKMAVTRNQWF